MIIHRLSDLQIVSWIVVVYRKPGACAPQEMGSSLHICPGGWKGVLVLVVEGEAVEWGDEVRKIRN